MFDEIASFFWIAVALGLFVASVVGGADFGLWLAGMGALYVGLLHGRTAVLTDPSYKEDVR